MQDLDNFVEKLRADVEARCGYSVHKKLLTYGYHLYSHGVFAWVRRVIHGRVVPDRCFPIQTKEYYAIKAGVANFADRRDGTGW